MAQYATAADLGMLLGITVDDSRADLILQAVSDEIAAYCTRVDFEQSTSTVSLQGTWSSELLLPGGPVTAVSSVTIDGGTLNSSNYEVHPHKLIRIGVSEQSFAGPSGKNWGGPSRRVSITYTHGFTDIPGLVEKMTLRAAGRVYVNPEQRRDVTLETGHRVVFERHEGVYLTAGDLMQLRNAGYRWETGNAR